VVELRVFGVPEVMTVVAERLRAMHGSQHVHLTRDWSLETALLTADLSDGAVDAAVSQLKTLGVPAQDFVLLRVDTIGPSAGQDSLANVVWADMVSQARANARPVARYLVFMAMAGIIAAFGVIYEETTLVVGAMAISPDALPISAAATALVLRRWRIARRALLALGLGLGMTWVVGAAMTFVLNQLSLLPDGFIVGQGGFLQDLSSVNVSTPIVAFAAGVAGMLALETRASSAVGVAISVTTIPASAYLGVATASAQSPRPPARSSSSPSMSSCSW
jgi:uncharacterized hydrophobic protein (TIGR00271 family)